VVFVNSDASEKITEENGNFISTLKDILKNKDYIPLLFIFLKKVDLSKEQFAQILH